jgi:hypothetical protein
MLIDLAQAIDSDGIVVLDELTIASLRPTALDDRDCQATSRLCCLSREPNCRISPHTRTFLSTSKVNLGS